MKRRSCLKSLKSRRHTVGLKCPTGSNCRHAWRCAVDQIFFFTSQRDAGSIFSWGGRSKASKAKREQQSVDDSIQEILTRDNSVARRQSLGINRRRSSSQARDLSQDLIDANNASLDKFEIHEAGKCGHRFPDNALPPLDEWIDKRNDGNRAESRGDARRMRYGYGQGRGQPLQSQRIVIGTEDLEGRDVARVVRQKMNALEKSPGHVVRSTALIVKCSKNGRLSNSGIPDTTSSEAYVLLSPPGEHSSVTTVVDKPKVVARDWDSPVSNSPRTAKILRASQLEAGNGSRQSWEWTGSQTDCCAVRSAVDRARSSSDSNLRRTPANETAKSNNIEETEEREEGKDSRRHWHKAFHLLLPSLLLLLLAVLFSLYLFDGPEEVHGILNSIRNQYCIPVMEAIRNRLG